METKKLSKLNINDFVKSSSAGSRLQSLRSPRDLSLGGTKLSKKNYTPNLNVVRHRDKAKVPLKRADKSRNKSTLPQDELRNRFIQSSGVFSEGIGDSVRVQQNNTYVRERKKIPSVKPAPERICKKSDDRMFEEIIKFEDEDSDTDKEVPFKPIEWCSSTLLEDPLDEIKPEMSDQGTLLPKEYADDTELQTTDNTKSPLTLWQLPDSFAFKSASEDSKSQKSSDCKLSDLPEGKIGKICVHKSGKTVLYIGSLKYELEPAELESSVEEVVSVNFNRSRESTAAVLGNINNRFLLNPHWNSLLDF